MNTPSPQAAPRPSNHMSMAEYREIQGKSNSKGNKRNGRNGKYNAIAVTTQEGRFDSTAEYERYLVLKLLERAGEITELTRQIPYSLDAGGIHISNYVADFVYKIKGVTIVEDVKGVRTPEYRLKRRLMREILGIEILETGRSDKRKKAPNNKKR